MRSLERPGNKWWVKFVHIAIFGWDLLWHPQFQVLTAMDGWLMEQDVEESEKTPFPAHFRTCPADELFDYVVHRLVEFSAAHGW